jgi:hypothetical protein
MVESLQRRNLAQQLIAKIFRQDGRPVLSG